MLINGDSFTYYDVVTEKYGASSTAVLSADAGRSGLPGIITDGSTFFVDNLTYYGQTMRLSGVVHGIAHQPDSLPASEVVLFQYQEQDGTVQVTVALDSTGALNVYRGAIGGTLLATSTFLFQVGAYPAIASKVFVDDTVGTVEIRVYPDADSEETIINFTGDTRNGGTGLISAISYGIDGSSSSGKWCDKYTCDLVGTFSDFLGNKRTAARLVSGAGSSTTWIPQPTVPNWQNVSHAPPSDSIFNASPDVSLDTIPTSDLFTNSGASVTEVDAAFLTLRASALPEVEVVEVAVPTAFGTMDTPLTTTSDQTLTGNLILASLVINVDNNLNPTPTQTDWTLISHQRAAAATPNTIPTYHHYLVFWRLAAGDEATTYDFSEAVSAFALNGTSSYVTNVVLRNQTTSWQYDLSEVAEDAPDPSTPPFTGGVNTITTSGTTAPDTFGHYNIILGFGDFSRHVGGHPQYALTPSFGHGYTQFDNGSSGGTDTGLFAYGLRAVNGVVSPDLTVDFNPGTSGGVAGALAVSLDIKPRTSPPGVNDYLAGARATLGGDTFQGFGQVPLPTAAFQQAPMETAPDGSAWTPASLDTFEAGYASSFSVDVIAAPAMALTVTSSNPTSGAAVTVSPTDNSGDSNGTTPFGREYVKDTPVNLTAAATAGGNPFAKWTRDGSDYAVTQATTVTMDDDHLMTAVYAGTCSTGSSILDMDGTLLTPQGDGTQITTWVENGTHAYTFVPVGGDITGPLYDTTPADNILYGTWDAMTPIQRGLKCTGPTNADIGLPNAFTIIAVVRTQAVSAGFPLASDLFMVDEGGLNSEGWVLGISTFGTNYLVQMQVFGQVGGGSGGGIDTGYIFDKTVDQKFLVSVVGDGTQVRIMINGQQVAGKEWFNNNDSSNIYTPGGTTSAAVLNAGYRNNPLYGRMPYLLIRNTNLSDSARQTIEAAQVATYGISGYNPGSCDVACVSS